MTHVRQSRIVATLVLALLVPGLAACGGDDDDGNGAEGKTVTAQNGEVTVTGRDIYFEETVINAEPGELTVTLSNQGAQQHSFRIDDPSIRVQAGPGQDETGSVEVDAGEYQYYCDVPGHRATMNGTLVVE
jgi:plastocyanin